MTQAPPKPSLTDEQLWGTPSECSLCHHIHQYTQHCRVYVDTGWTRYFCHCDGINLSGIPMETADDKVNRHV